LWLMSLTLSKSWILAKGRSAFHGKHALGGSPKPEVEPRSAHSKVNRAVPRDIQIHVRALSGELLASSVISDLSTVACLKGRVQDFMKPGVSVGHVVLGDRTLRDDETLGAAGLVVGDSLTAVLKFVPTMHVFKPGSAMQLTQRLAGCTGLCSKCGKAVIQPVFRLDAENWALDAAPSDDVAIAKRLHHESQQQLETAGARYMERLYALDEPFWHNGKICRYNPMCMGRGEVVVISNSGTDLSETCMTALGIEQEYGTSHNSAQNRMVDEDQQALVETMLISMGIDPHSFNTQPAIKTMDWGELFWVLVNGFAFYNQQGMDDEASDIENEAGLHDEEWHRITRIILLMQDTLTRHFRFCHHNRDSATFLFGGFTPHGCIVGILGMHCLTRTKPGSKVAARTVADVDHD